MLAAADLLAADGIQASVVHVPCLKPLDEEALLAGLAGHDLIVTVEEHSIYGGLGGLVAELVTSAGAAPRVERIGVQDTWGESAGNDYMLDQARPVGRARRPARRAGPARPPLGTRPVTAEQQLLVQIRSWPCRGGRASPCSEGRHRWIIAWPG